jgi:16S rRNA (cytosine1402-N4)-methyltransferase
MKNEMEHIPVLTEEMLKFFADSQIEVFFEGTVGAGGHAKAILEAHPEIQRYLGCDLDPEALKIAEKQLKPWKDKVELIHGNFSQLDDYLNERKIKTVDGFFLT